MKNIAVVGAGTMGNGIAHIFAQSGFKVVLTDIAEPMLEKALANIEQNLTRQVAKGVLEEEGKLQALANLTTTTSLEKATAQAHIVIEAASENFDIKAQIFKQLDQICPPETILATNTSSISITKIAAVTQRPDKVIGMHFFNPVPVMKLVEVINGYATSAETTQTVLELSAKVGKIATSVNDYPGFVANRVLMPMINEAIYALYEGVGGVEEIDTVMKLGMAHPMGPLQLADFVGLDICLNILRVLHEGLGNPKYAPCPLLVNMVEAGHKGIKTGMGFYDYSLGGKNLVVAARFKKA
ncbi:MAG TPA: 3-hydroxybutyryl-CoA dehydrogenase [Microscillaceae bacterium]|jgi:3-hydroxybutyryl-CoA dehydrogenase|nr:3-hydroxybutyryl-CoA dehydrogenase [Microscillaceae bacterium]